MSVHLSPPQRSLRQHGLLSGIAAAAPAADITGRLLAPGLLATCPTFLIALSPSDPHLLLARGESMVLLVSLAFVVRLGRAWAIFRTTDLVAHRLRPGRVQRLIQPSTDSRLRQHGAIGAVVLLPGMLGAVVAARARVQTRLYLLLATASTASGLAITLTAARLFDNELAAATTFITSHAVEATLLIAVVTVVSVVARRARESPTVLR